MIISEQLCEILRNLEAREDCCHTLERCLEVLKLEIEDVIRKEMHIGFKDDLSRLLNKHGMDELTKTPDFILAEHVQGFLKAFALTIKKRDVWKGGDPV